MKWHLKYIAICLGFILVSCTSSKTLPETMEKVTRQVEAKDYTITARYANPFRGRQIYLTSEYDLRVKNDSAFAFLPYFGVAHVAPYNPSEGGIKFAQKMDNYSAVPNKKKNGWDIRFDVTDKEYNYTIHITLFNNGSASFSVNSYQRDVINFHGELKF